MLKVKSIKPMFTSLITTMDKYEHDKLTTGGLIDTIIPYNKFTLEGTGFSFNSYNPQDFKDIIFEALELYTYKDNFKKLRQKVVNLDFSWDRSAKAYEDIYKL